MRQQLPDVKWPAHLRPLALAAAMFMAVQAQAQVPAPSFTQNGANSTSGIPSGLPFVGNPASLNFGTDNVFIGNGAAGSFAALAGAVLQAGGLSVALGGTGVGTFTATGINASTGQPTRVLIGGSNGGLEVGNWGNATMTVSGGALVDATVNPLNCGAGCYSLVGNAAGSTALLEITGASSEVRTLRNFTVGQTAVFTLAGSDFEFGTPGGTTNATVNVLAGGKLSNEPATVGVNSLNPDALGTEKGNGTVLVNGAGSQWLVKHNSIDPNQAAGMFIGLNAGGTGTVTISGGGNLTVDNSTGPQNANPFINIGQNSGQGSLTVTGNGSALNLGSALSVFNAGGIQVGRSGNGTVENSFSVLAGASASATFLNVGRDGAKGTVLLDGAGSTLTLSGYGPYASGGNGAAVGTIGWNGGTGKVTVDKGALWTINDMGVDTSANGGRGPGITIGTVGGNGTVEIKGANSLVSLSSRSINPAAGSPDNANPYVNLGVGTGSVGTLNISAGGKLLLTGNAASTPDFERGTYLAVGGTSDTTPGGTGTMSITGPGSETRLTGSDAFVSVGRNGTGTLDLSDGALLAAASINVGRGTTATTVGNGTMTMDAARVELSGFFTNSIGSGASLSVGNRGGTGSLTMINGSTATVTNLSPAGASFNLGGTTPNPLGNGALNMSGGSSITVTAGAGLGSASIGRDGTGLAVLQGNSKIDIGDGSVHVARLATGNGTVELRSGSKMLAGSVNIGGTSDTDAGGIGSVLVTGLGSELRASGPVAFIGVGRGGTGTLTVEDSGRVAATAMSIGRNGATGGNGKLNVDNATIELSGQQTAGNLVGANFAIGLGGATGEAKISGGSAVNITNYTVADNAGADLLIGGSSRYPLGTGKLELSGGSQINVLAAPGVGGAATLGAVTIGNDGTGRAELSGGSSINVGGGSVYVARQVGPADLSGFSGTLILNNSTINAGFVGVGVSAPGIGNALGAPGGIGKLVLNDSTIKTSRFELGVGSVLTGNNGVIDAGLDGPVVIGGTIRPGTSPGRIRIKCDVTMLATSKLILEINDRDGGPGVDFDIDELIIGDDSKFDLTSLQIIFSFMGNTNPNEFAASEGGFSLDRFLLASSADDQILGGLSILFGNKRNPDTLNWGQAVNSQLFTFESSVYDVSEIGFDPETGQIDVAAAARIPEPASFALVLLALAALALARRRRAALPR